MISETDDSRKHLTLPQLRTLSIVIKYPGIQPKFFTKLMWLDSEWWAYHIGCGRGSHQGAGMAQAGESYLGKLRKLKLVRIVEEDYNENRYYATTLGIERFTGDFAHARSKHPDLVQVGVQPVAR